MNACGKCWLEWSICLSTLRTGKGFYNEVTVEPVQKTKMNALGHIEMLQAPPNEAGSRPTRPHRRHARFDDDEIYGLQQQSRARRYTIDALPEHSQAEYTTREGPNTKTIPRRGSLPADH
ncbi:hypothetical protein PT974_10216 [Cladobotryum mycophilum]|uniref:Uncharacterized protein n=1 Tax=Cladobotryum mycophilum TaxID=491253 RepID=A0ABR0SA54_9HYPO